MATQSRDYLRNTAVIASLTMVSRLLGLVRDMVCAGYFGAGLVWDAFSFAFRIPNLFRKLFGEGALSAAFIPVFTEYLELHERKDAWRLAGMVISVVGAVLLACLLLGECLVLIIPRVTEVSERWRLALALTAVLLPYMLFICLTALAAAILNSLKHFAVPALAPVVLNVCWIIAVVVVAPLVSDDAAERAFVVASGIVVAGVFQLLLQLAALRAKEMHWDLSVDLKHPGLRRIATAMGPVVLGLAAVQINVLLDGVIAISLAAPEGEQTFALFGTSLAYPMRLGANSVLYYGNRIMQFPLGVFGIALATAIFPTLSAHAAHKDWDSFGGTLIDGLGAVLLIGIPAGAGLILLRQPIIELLFERGEFTADASARTAAVLAAYSTGIWAYCATHVLARAFYSVQDTVTPLKVALGVVVLNLALNLTLVWALAETGLALATAISAAVQAILLYLILTRKTKLKGQGRLLKTLLKTCLATAVMVAAVLAALHWLPEAPPRDQVAVKLVRVFAPLAAGIIVFCAAAVLLRIPEMKLLLSAVARRVRRQEGP